VKIYGEGEWLDQKHGVRSRRRWRKLHLAVDADTHEIAAVELTPDDIGDVSVLPDLLDQIEEPVGSVTADGAYDGDAIYDEALQRHLAARVIIPPSTAILSDAGTTQRDDHLRSIEQHGRLGWQRRSGYGRRSLVETAMYRYKTIIGRRLHARTLLNQRIEAKIGCNVLNRMTSIACQSQFGSNNPNGERRKATADIHAPTRSKPATSWFRLKSLCFRAETLAVILTYSCVYPFRHPISSQSSPENYEGAMAREPH
jgi:hypothetical protein